MIVGKIYAEWCGHCIALKPEWAKMKTVLSRRGNYEFVEIPHDQQHSRIPELNELYLKNSATPLALQGGYPTIFKIHKGQIEYYNGPRTRADLVYWVKKANSKAKSRVHGGLARNSRKTRKNGWFLWG